LPGAIASDATADAVETAELLDFDAKQVARLIALVTTHRLGRFAVPQPRRSRQHPAHRRR
jgi:hypothetical protein